jgi:N-acetyl-gamma-glutamyl-phosphate reductase
MINAAVCGITGYTGLELIRVLSRHPKVKISVLTARFEKPANISDVYPEFKGRLDIICQELCVDEIVKKHVDCVFLALPHKISMEYAPKFVDKGCVVIDLSADFRLKDTAVYEKYYQKKHTAKNYVPLSVYGMPEIYRDRIKKARLLANPGCYPTGSILALAPLAERKLISKIEPVILDAKSGVTGAGKKPDAGLIFGEVAENMKAYKIGTHQHAPEIEQELRSIAKEKISIIFTPHLIPIRRGILTTAYVPLKKKSNITELIKIYKAFYKKALFVKVYESGVFPEIKDVTGTNNCALGIALSPDGKKAIIITAIDNLLKGASGQAVQNMNIIYGLPEGLGLL